METSRNHECWVKDGVVKSHLPGVGGLVASSTSEQYPVSPLSLIGPQGFELFTACPCRPSQLWALSSQLPSRRPAFLLACWGETCVPVLPLGQVTLIYWNLFIVVGPVYYIGTRLSKTLIPFFREDSSFHVASVGAFGL